MKRRWVSRSLVWTARIVSGCVILFALAFGYGTTSGDAEKMRLFHEAVLRWQHNPDFRDVQVEYVDLGTQAMCTRAAFIKTASGVLFLRSLPGLPEHLRVNPTSYAHYDNFTRGPLSAYMHLTSEQGLDDTLKMLQALGQKPDLAAADIEQFIRQFKLHIPVVSDTGAVKGVRRLINDTDAGRGFAVKDDVPARLKTHIAAVAGERGFPADLKQMTPAQQKEVWVRLDDYVKQQDYELWRTKQVNDWLNGVWAQVYGTMYSGLIAPSLKVRDVCQIVGPLWLLAWCTLVWLRWRKLAGAGEIAAAPIVLSAAEATDSAGA